MSYQYYLTSSSDGFSDTSTRAGGSQTNICVCTRRHMCIHTQEQNRSWVGVVQDTNLVQSTRATGVQVSAYVLVCFLFLHCPFCHMSCNSQTVRVYHSFTVTPVMLPGFCLDTTDTDRVKFSIVISSENLLLNLYRVYKSPQRLTIALDHTYHLMTENRPTLLIGVTTPGNNQ